MEYCVCCIVDLHNYPGECKQWNKFFLEDYKDADFWIATRNDYGPDGEKSEIKGKE